MAWARKVRRTIAWNSAKTEYFAMLLVLANIQLGGQSAVEMAKIAKCDLVEAIQGGLIAILPLPNKKLFFRYDENHDENIRVN